MVTFTCNEKDCKNKGIDYNFLGEPKTAMCGACKATLEAKDLRPDPVIQQNPLYPESE
jgi:hypothetical protein